MMEFSFILYFISFIWPHHTACRILVPWPESKSVSPALEDTVLTAVYQGSAFNLCLKSLYSYFKFWIFRMSFSLGKLIHEIPPSFIYICVCVFVCVCVCVCICIYNWRISALQGCVGFCHTTWLSHRWAYVPPPSWTCLPLPTLFWPSRLSQSFGLNSLHPTGNSHRLSSLLMVTVCFKVTSICLTPSFPCCVHKSVLCLPLYCYPANRFISTFI